MSGCCEERETGSAYKGWRPLRTAGDLYCTFRFQPLYLRLLPSTKHRDVLGRGLMPSLLLRLPLSPTSLILHPTTRTPGPAAGPTCVCDCGVVAQQLHQHATGLKQQQQQQQELNNATPFPRIDTSKLPNQNYSTKTHTLAHPLFPPQPHKPSPNWPSPVPFPLPLSLTL